MCSSDPCARHLEVRPTDVFLEGQILMWLTCRSWVKLKTLQQDGHESYTLKTNMSPKIGTISSSSHHWFSGDMLVFGGVNITLVVSKSSKHIMQMLMEPGYLLQIWHPGTFVADKKQGLLCKTIKTNVWWSIYERSKRRLKEGDKRFFTWALRCRISCSLICKQEFKDSQVAGGRFSSSTATPLFVQDQDSQLSLQELKFRFLPLLRQQPTFEVIQEWSSL